MTTDHTRPDQRATVQRFEDLRGFNLGLAHVCRGELDAAETAFGAGGALAAAGRDLVARTRAGGLDPLAVMRCAVDAGSRTPVAVAVPEARRVLEGRAGDARWVDALDLGDPIKGLELKAYYAFIGQRLDDGLRLMKRWARSGAPMSGGYRQLAVRALLRRGRVAAAERLAHTVLDPDLRLPLLAEAALVRGEHAQGAQHLAAWGEAYPGPQRRGAAVPASVKLAAVLLGGDSAPAEPLATTAVVLGKIGAAERISVGLMRENRGLLDEAVALYTAAAQADPADAAWAHHLAATALAKAGRAEDAAARAALARALHRPAVALYAAMDEVLGR